MKASLAQSSSSATIKYFTKASTDLIPVSMNLPLLSFLIFVNFSFGLSTKHLIPVNELEARTDPFQMKIYTHNVRYAAPGHKRRPHELSWLKRRYGVIASIKRHVRDTALLVGLQECKHEQVIDILNGLNGLNGLNDLSNDHDSHTNEMQQKNWSYYGIGRDNGHTKGEYAPIFYDKDEWELLNATTRWLSHTPLKPSKFPSAGSKRIVTLTTFKHKNGGQIVNYVNTHLDDRSEKARVFGMQLIMQYVKQIPNTHPTILSGDFNSKSNNQVYKLLAAEKLVDTFSEKLVKSNNDPMTLLSELSKSSKSPKSPTLPTLPTFSGFGNATGYTIDYIWNMSPESGIKILGHEVDDNLFDQGFRFSDHRPVIARFSIV